MRTFTIDLDSNFAQFLTPVQDKKRLEFLRRRILRKLDARLPEHAFRLVQANKDLMSIRNLRPDIILKIELRGSLKGGKGGFGSLLRRIKPKAKDDQNYEACRDLSGRRLRHVNNE
jgi:hypothetical protein